MSLSRKLLIDGEEVVLSVRTHAKAVVLPAIVLVVLVGIAGYLTALVSAGDGSDVTRWVVIGIWVAAAVAVTAWSLVPFLRWWGTRYTVTNLRVLATSGLFTRTGRAIPLQRLNDVQFEQGVVDRLLGCGTLIVSEASEQGGMRLTDVPQVESVHKVLTALVFDSDDRSDDGGSMPRDDPGAPEPR